MINNICVSAIIITGLVKSASNKTSEAKIIYIIHNIFDNEKIKTENIITISIIYITQ